MLELVLKIVKALDDKLKLIDLAKGVCHLGRIPYEEVYFSSRYIEGAMLVYLKSLNLVAPSKAYDVSYDGSDGRFNFYVSEYHYEFEYVTRNQDRKTKWLGC